MVIFYDCDRFFEEVMFLKLEFYILDFYGEGRKDFIIFFCFVLEMFREKVFVKYYLE